MWANEKGKNRKLAMLLVGEVLYFETTQDRWKSDMRSFHIPKARRSAELREKEFKTSMFTAVSAKMIGEIRYLLAVERVK